jgi:hypothetical protein
MLFMDVSAQSKPAKKTTKVKPKEEEIQEPPPPPPPPEELREVKIARVDTLFKGKRTADKPVELELPPVNFDTTAVPDDQFSKDILALLEITNALNLGIQFATAINDDKNSATKEFYEKLYKDVKEGTARRWIERLYIRQYRQRFSHEEIKEMVKFYESPVGKKLIIQTAEMLPGIVQESKKMSSYLVMKIYSDMLKEKNSLLSGY